MELHGAGVEQEGKVVYRLGLRLSEWACIEHAFALVCLVLVIMTAGRIVYIPNKASEATPASLQAKIRPTPIETSTIIRASTPCPSS